MNKDTYDIIRNVLLDELNRKENLCDCDEPNNYFKYINEENDFLLDEKSLYKDLLNLLLYTNNKNINENLNKFNINKYDISDNTKIEILSMLDDFRYRILSNIQKIEEKEIKFEYDRVGDWDRWAQKMHNYIESFTVEKYGTKNDDSSGFDLMTITEPRMCIWNILKYALRLWKGKGKIHDIHKISHYAQMAETLCKGDLSKAGITNERGD